MTTNEHVLIIHDGPVNYLDGLRERFPDVPFDLCTQDETIPEALARVEPTIVLSFRSGRFQGPLHAPIVTAPSVTWLNSGGAGIDHLPHWDTSKITVTNASGVASRFMAETVTGAILMMNFGFPQYIEDKRAKVWNKNDWTSLEDKTALIIGLGSIGTDVAKRLKHFGMTVIGARHSAKPNDVVDGIVTMDNLKDALGRADYVCIHVANTPSTYHLVNADFLSAMKPTARLINTARGPQVDEDALLGALTTNQIAGAYLDVFKTEPLPETSPLWEAPNLIISPHVSDSVTGWEYNSAQFFADNLERRLKGESLHNICDPDLGY